MTRTQWKRSAVAWSGALLLSGAVFVGRVQWRLQVPTVPWSTTEVQRSELWPLLVESPHREQLDLALHWRGGIIHGENWLRSQRRNRLDPWSMEHWAAREPTVYFVPPGSADLELELQLEVREGAAAWSHLSPTLNGVALPPRELATGRNTMTVALRRDLLVPGINELRLRFDAAASVADRNTRTKRSERSVSFTKAALRRTGRIPSSLDGRHLELEAGSVVRVPFSAATPTRMRMTVQHASPAATLRVEALVGDQRQALLNREVNDGERIELDAPRDGFGRIELGFDAAPGARARVLFDVDRLPSSEAGATGLSPKRPNVFVYVIDTLRADAVDLHDGPASPTPHMARFAADAVVFERAWSPSSWTRPSTRALLDGVYPGAASRSRAGAGWTLAQAQSSAGYETLAVSQNFIVSRARFGAGFASYYTSDALSRGSNEGHAAAWFLWHHLATRGPSDRPLFAYLHTIDPHGPYTPYAEDRGSLPWWVAWRPLKYEPTVVERDGGEGDVRRLEIMRRLYAGDVRHADRSFGAFVELLRFLGLYEDSVIILCSDHGEAFGEHGVVGHGRTLYEEELRVPLMIKLPGMRAAGRRVRERVSTVAVAPTVLELVGITPPEHLADGSLLAEGRHARPLRAQLTRKARGERPQREMHAVVEGDLKCVCTTTDGQELTIEAFDLGEDPQEVSRLVGGDVLDRCRSLLADGAESLSGAAHEPPVSDEVRQRLEALGYVDQL